MDKRIYLFIYFVAVYITDTWCKNADSKVHEDSGNKIVGGEEATIELYPYQARLTIYYGSSNFNYCGGTIVSEHIIITAAHCLSGATSIEVRIGSSDSSFGGLVYNSTTYNMHPWYDITAIDYDIGIITVNKDMDFKKSVAKPIDIACLFNDPEEHEMMVVSGWGDTKEGGVTSNTLRAAEVPVVDRRVCNKQLQGVVTTRMFCAGYERGGVDTCQGDSGGPAVSRKTGKLTGITSYGYGCARAQAPGVYTRIGHLSIRTYITLMTGII